MRKLSTAVAACAALLGGCGAGTAAIASSGGSSSAGAANTPTQLVAVDVTSARVSPALISFRVVDPDLDSARVEVRYTTDGTFDGSSIVGVQTVAGGAGAGTPASQSFDFGAVLGSALTQDVIVFAVIEGSRGIDLGINARSVSFGNDAPGISVGAATLPVAPLEASGPLPINFTLSDSSGDDLRVRVQFTDEPQAAAPVWRDARPSGLPSGAGTPAFAFDRVTGLPGGTNLTFAWDTDFDLGGRDTEVRLRFRATEVLAPGESTPEADGLTPVFRVDNNEPPVVAMDVVGFALNPDGSRVIPAPFSLSDAEGDAVELLFQWREQSGEFPALPAEVDSLRQVARDPAARRALQIATESPRSFEGAIGGFPGPSSARLPELATSAAILATRRASPAESLTGMELQVLRPSPLAPLASGWAANPLAAPAGAVLAEGGRALVLDAPVPGRWRVRSIDLATGVAGAPLGGERDGIPDAIAALPGESAVLVAFRDAGTWGLARVDVLADTAEVVFTAGPDQPSGDVRGLAARGGARVLVTVGGALVEVVLGSQARTLLPPGVLVDPRGVAVAPGDDELVWIAETGRDRVVQVDLATLALSTVRAPFPGLPRPTALAVEWRGRRLLVLADANPSDGAREVVAVLFGLRPAGAGTTHAVAQIAAVPAGVRALAAGEGGARLAVDPQGELFAGGGVEQVREVTGYDPMDLRVTVDAPFAPPVVPGDRWRLVERATVLKAGAPGRGIFRWDSRDVPGTIDVELRALAFDRDVGPVAASSPKSLRGELDSAPVQEHTSAVRFAGDFDGDGDTDFVTVSELVLQTSPGTFSATPLPLLAPELVRDIDGDGLADLVGGEMLYRLIQASPPTFAAGLPIGGFGSLAMDAGDIDRDGRTDILLSSGEVRYQTAPLVFSSGPGAGAASFPLIDPLLRDGDGDGDLDVVYGNASVELQLQDDQGEFRGVESILGGLVAESFSMAASDLDRDGLLDFVAPQPFDTFFSLPGVLTIAFGDGPVVEIDPPTGASGSLRAELHDANGDGLRDLVVQQQGAAVTSIVYQSSPGVLRSAGDRILTLGGTPRLPRDIDGDGGIDLVGADPTGAGGRVVYSEAPIAFSAQPAQELGFALTSFEDCAVADFDGDGDVDIVATEPLIGLVHFIFQQRPGVFGNEPTVTFLDEVLPRRIEAAELNGDGRTDYFTALGPGSGGGLVASSGGDFRDAFAAFARDLQAVDLDGAGTLEVLRITEGGFSGPPELEVWRRGAVYAPLFSPALTDVTSARVVDADGDGLGDLFLAVAGQGVRLLRQGPLDVFTSVPVAPGEGGEVVLAEDLDGDGRVDFAASGGGQTRLYFQGATGSFQLAPVTLPFAAGGLIADDLDDDGMLDLVAGGTRLAFQVLPRVFVENQRMASPGVSATALGDIDGDGELDMVTVTGSSLETRYGGR